MPEQVSVQRDGAVETLVLSNPPMNFISNAMLGELYQELLRARADDAVRAIVLTGGVDGSFLTHFDINDSLEHSQQVKRHSPWVTRLIARLTYWLCQKAHRRPWLDRMVIRSLASKPPAELGAYYWVRCLDILDTMPKPVVAAINGLCLGGGCELSLCCDLRLMADEEHYRIGLPEVLVGILPGGTGTTYRLPRIVGEGTALELMMTGRLCRPREAHELGLVHSVLPAAELGAAAALVAARLTRSAPIALAQIRHAIRHGSRLGQRRARVVDLAAINTVMASDDARAGLAWYLKEVLAKRTELDAEEFVATLGEFAERGGADVEFEGR